MQLFLCFFMHKHTHICVFVYYCRWCQCLSSSEQQHRRHCTRYDRSLRVTYTLARTQSRNRHMRCSTQKQVHSLMRQSVPTAHICCTHSCLTAATGGNAAAPSESSDSSSKQGSSQVRFCTILQAHTCMDTQSTCCFADTCLVFHLYREQQQHHLHQSPSTLLPLS